MNKENLKPKAKLDIISRKASVYSQNVIHLNNPINKIKNNPILRDKCLNQTYDSTTLNRSLRKFNLEKCKTKQAQAVDFRDLQLKQLRAEVIRMSLKISQYQINQKEYITELKACQQLQTNFKEQVKYIKQKQKFHEQQKKTLQQRIIELQNKLIELEQQMAKEKASRINKSHIQISKEQNTQSSRITDSKELKQSTYLNFTVSGQGNSIDQQTSSKIQKSYKREYQLQKIKRINAEKMIQNAQQNAKNQANLEINLLKKKIQTLTYQVMRKKNQIQQKEQFINNLVFKNK